MTTHEPLSQALSRAAYRAVKESKIGPRKGSVAAVARAMEERGLSISKNTLARKLDGEYPLDSDEIAALCAVIRMDPDTLWREALRIMPRERTSIDDLGADDVAPLVARIPDPEGRALVEAADAAEAERRARG